MTAAYTIGRTRAARAWLVPAGLAMALAGFGMPARAAAPAPTATSAAPAPAASDQTIAEGLITTTRAIAGPKLPKECGQADASGAIVVCGIDRGERWRVPSTTDSDPSSREAQDTGVPRAPNVSSLPDCSRGCIGFGKVPERVLEVDFSKLPPAPPGSDADKIAKGEMREP